MNKQPETAHEQALRLLGWFVDQFAGESGTGLEHWRQSPEFVEAELVLMWSKRDKGEAEAQEATQ
jgi:hypothetical protein